jgi:diguanylate cyclase (GGDEF)-like protein
MSQHVILLTDALEPPAAELTGALQEAGLVAFIEVLREVDISAIRPDPQDISLLPRELEPAPLAVLYELVPGTEMVEIYAAVEHALALWPGTPLVACRRTLLATQKQGLRILESSTLRRLGFSAVADEPAQLPALLRKMEERGNTGELRLAAEKLDPFFTETVELPVRLSRSGLRSAFELVAVLHLAADQRSAAHTAIEGLRRLVDADRWTIYLATNGSNASAMGLEPLAVRTSESSGEVDNDDWRRTLLTDALVTTGPVSDAAHECVAGMEVVKKRSAGKRVVSVPLVSGDRVVGALEAVREQAGSRTFSRTDTRLLEALASPIASALANSMRIAEAERLSQTDDLTKLHNARYLRQFLLSEVKRARRYGSCVSALFLDLDDFKKINDVHGHLAGSHVLMEMATIILSSVRDTDVVARYGGDEFVVILPETGVEQATQVAERIRDKIYRHPFTGGRRLELRLTASFGVASFPQHAQSPQQLVAFADTAMYEAKADGKNRVSLSGTLSSIYNDENALPQ